MQKRLSFFLFVACGVAPLYAYAAVTINEVAWMGTGNSASDEWIELYADTDTLLDEWMLETVDGGMQIHLTGSISKDGHYLIERTDDESVPGIAADLVSPFGSGLSNAGEGLILKNSMGDIVDSIHAEGGWPAGDNTTKDTMQKSGNVWMTAPGTPRAKNAGGESSDVVNAPEDYEGVKKSDTSGGVPYIPPEKLPHISAYAGKDTYVVSGEQFSLEGAGTGFIGDQLNDARYSWNMGDGAVREGKSIVYAYAFPGTYTVRLTVVSGKYSAFDDMLVRVSKNALVVSEIRPGPDGWIEFYNGGSHAVDMGRWILETSSHAGDRFYVPQGTVVASKSYIVLQNSVTHMTNGFLADTLAFFYPNGEMVERVSYPVIADFANSFSRTSRGEFVVSHITPGEKNTEGETSSILHAPQKANAKNAAVMAASSKRSSSGKNEEIAGDVHLEASYSNQEGALTSTEADNNRRGASNFSALFGVQSAWQWFLGSILVGLLSGVLILMVRVRYKKEQGV